jgi:tRNA uridine 5-carboxymethylaminomethyl modification enzyme
MQQLIQFDAGQYQVGVIGAGHAGCEAALAAARLGCKTVLFTLSLDQIANMPCNPSIGGTAKGHIVREIDALGGEMGRVADATTIQSRMLNRGKGPAVHSLRTQNDRMMYHLTMKHVLETTPNLHIVQGEVVDILTKDKTVCGVVTAFGAIYKVSAVVICSGTYLNGKVIVGEYARSSGPDGCHAAGELTNALVRLGIPLRRFKTGTPARVHRDSIDLSRFSVQAGDDLIIPFSDDTLVLPVNKAICHMGYTNENTHAVIRQNLHRSPLFCGVIEGTGPRYCPSIEDKVVRFADKHRHQFFIEPMGENTKEMYLQGLSSSLPFEIQQAIYQTIEGMENVQIMRPAYAIEYDCADPLALTATLESKAVKGLYGAGQFNGTSGYEEAAAQGLIAGINAANAVREKPPFVLMRDDAYIGTLIDDLVTRGTNEPYRMMTSRSEYRLLLRQDNAAARLTKKGREIGLISDARWHRFKEAEEQCANEIERLKKTTVKPDKQLALLCERSGTPLPAAPMRLDELIRRPQITYAMLARVDENRPCLTPAIANRVEIEIKYEGYIKKQREQALKMGKYLAVDIQDINFEEIKGLRLEAKEKLLKVNPITIGQAMGISGVSPADISILMLEAAKRRRERKTL